MWGDVRANNGTRQRLPIQARRSKAATDELDVLSKVEQMAAPDRAVA